MEPVIRRTRVGLLSGRRLSSLSIAKVTPCVRIMMERAVVRVAGLNGNGLGGHDHGHRHRAAGGEALYTA